MAPILVILRVNGGAAYASFKVWARNDREATITAKIHLMSAYGLDII